MIGVASLLGSAACLPTYDQPAAHNAAVAPNNPTTSSAPVSGSDTAVAPLTPAEQTAIWMQGGDPVLLANRAYDEGPIEVASTKHSCMKTKYDVIGKLLQGRGVNITAGINPATLPVSINTVNGVGGSCPTQTSANTQSSAFVYCTAALTLGLPQYSARLGEATSLTSGTATKMMDLYATAATEIEQSLTVVNGYSVLPAAFCNELSGAKAQMFDSSNNCMEGGITCLQGYPATPSQVALCSSVVTQAQANGAITAMTAGRRLAIATVMAGSLLCE
jgi:hypothetical protein